MGRFRGEEGEDGGCRRGAGWGDAEDSVADGSNTGPQWADPTAAPAPHKRPAKVISWKASGLIRGLDKHIHRQGPLLAKIGHGS